MNDVFDNIHSSLEEKDFPYILPNGWKWYKWGDLVKSYEQGMIRSNLDLVDNNEGTFYFKMHNISSDGFSNYIKKEYTITSDEELKKYELKNGDFLINVRNSYELVGKTCVVNNIENNATYNHMLIKVVHLFDDLNYYINALFSKTSWSKYIDGCKKGTTTVIALYKEDLMNIPIPIPDKNTLDSIISFEKCVNYKVNINKQITENLNCLADTLYNYIFNQYKDISGQDKEFEYDENLDKKIPKNWRVVELGDILEFEKGKIPSELHNEKKNGLQKYLTIDVVNGGVPQYCSEDKMKKCNGETLMVMDGAASGDVYVGYEGVIGSTFSKIISKEKEISNSLVYRILNNCKKNYKRANTGSTVPHANKSYIEKIKIAIPKEIEDFSNTFDKIQQLIINNENEIFDLLRLRNFIIPFIICSKIQK